VHLHGTADRLLIYKALRADFELKGAGHFMVWNRAQEVSDIVNGVLAGHLIYSGFRYLQFGILICRIE
jgi:hypothetical protein